MKEITLSLYESGFEKADSNFNSLTLLDNGDLYYTLCSHNIDIPGRSYRLKKGAAKPELLADLGEVCEDDNEKRIPQGKSHTPYYRYGEDIWFATHCSFYGGNEGGKESPAPPPEGYLPYSGGRIIRIDPQGRFHVMAAAPAEEGIITMTMDTDRGICYCLTWPSGLLLVYNVAENKLINSGKVALDGEIGQGERYSCLCRIFAVEPSTGRAYFTLSDGRLFSTDKTGEVVLEEWCNLKREVFGSFDPTVGGHQGYNWRYLVYNKKYKCFFGIHGKSGWLFRFEPTKHIFEVMDRIAALPCRKDGSFESFRYGYMTLAQAPDDDDTLYYISGYTDQETGTPRLCPLTYHIPTGKITDYGALRLPNGYYPSRIQTLAVNEKGDWFVCPWTPADEQPEKAYHCELATFRVDGENG